MRYQPLEAPSSTPQRSVLESTCPAEDPFRSATRRTKAMDFESWFEMAKAQVQRLEDEKDGVATAPKRGQQWLKCALPAVGTARPAVAEM